MPDVPRLHKRGQIWWTWVYADGHRSARSTGCRDRKAAELFARDLERAAADPTYAAANETSLGQALSMLVQDRLEQARAGRKSIHTAEMYRKQAGHWLRILEYDATGKHTPLALAALQPPHGARRTAYRRIHLAAAQ